MNEETFYERLKRLLDEEEITQRQLESDLELGNATVSKWKKSTPKWDTIEKLANYLMVNVEHLMSGCPISPECELKRKTRILCKALQSSDIPFKGQHCYGKDLIHLYFENSLEQFKMKERNDHPTFTEYLTAILLEKGNEMRELLGERVYIGLVTGDEILQTDNGYLGIEFSDSSHYYAVEHLAIPNIETLDIMDLFKYTDNVKTKIVESLWARALSEENTLPKTKEADYLMPEAAHNDFADNEEELRLMQEDLDEL
jgi:transcriptional regulator with XRE-family HTH domain